MSRRRAPRALMIMVAIVAVATATPTPVAAQPPTNDDVADALAIAPLPFTDAVDTTEATTEESDPSCSGNGFTVWYSFTSSSELEIVANTFGSDYDTTLSVYTGTTGSLEQVACNDDTGSLQSSIRFTADAGIAYLIMIASCCDTQGGQLEFSFKELAPPANNDIAQASEMAPLPFTDSVTTLLATSDPDDPECFGNAESVWYTLEVGRTGTFQVSTLGSGYDTTLSVYTGSPEDLTQLRCADIPGGSERVRFRAGPGVTYFVMVGTGPGAGEAGGELAIEARRLPSRLALGIRIDPIATIGESGIVTVRGTLTCSRDASNVTIVGVIRQQRGDIVAVGSYSTTADCDGRVRWRAKSRGETARFRKDNARVVAAVAYFDGGRKETILQRASRQVLVE